MTWWSQDWFFIFGMSISRVGTLLLEDFAFILGQLIYPALTFQKHKKKYIGDFVFAPFREKGFFFLKLFEGSDRVESVEFLGVEVGGQVERKRLGFILVGPRW